MRSDQDKQHNSILFFLLLKNTLATFMTFGLKMSVLKNQNNIEKCFNCWVQYKQDSNDKLRHE